MKAQISLASIIIVRFSAWFQGVNRLPLFVTPLSKKELLFLITMISVTLLSSLLSTWAPVLIMMLGVFFVILLNGIDALNKLLFFAIPLSVESHIPGLGDIMFPSELLAIVVFGFTVVNLIAYRKLWRKSDYHPASGALLILWLALCYGAYESNLPIVSLKSLLIFTLYAVSFYLQWFIYSANASQKIEEAIRYYFGGLIIVCLLTTIEHASYGFARPMAMRVPPPFFSDHTIYGTCLAFFIPMIYYWIKSSSSLLTKAFYISTFSLFLIAIFTTYSRAVWMSLIVVLGVYYLLHIKVPIRKLLTAAVVIIILFVSFQESAIEYLSENRSDSKARKAEVSDQLKSVGNISTDVSNLERINRWKSALSMFNTKPLSGYGPGTYQFNFISHQRPEDKTPISVSRASDHFSQGMGGTAHSQYLLYASESGIFAVGAFIALILFTVREAFNMYYDSSDAREKLYLKALLGGYITFVFHSFFNNFLDIDKSASLFFVFNAGIILLAVEKKRKKQYSIYQNNQTNGN